MATESSGRSREWDLRDYVSVLRRRAWVIVGAGVLAGAAAGGLSSLQSKAYEATADVLIQRQQSDQVFTNGNPVFDPKRDIQTEVKVLNSSAVRRAAVQAIGRAPDISISSDDTSNLVGVSAQAPTGRQA